MTPQQQADATPFAGDPFDLITEVPFRLVMEGQRVKSVSQPLYDLPGDAAKTRGIHALIFSHAYGLERNDDAYSMVGGGNV